MIHVKRAYESVGEMDGKRFLVDRLWPRGLKKTVLQVEGWLKTVAPSDQLRRWFGHEPSKWEAFQRRYFAELEAKPEAWEPLRKAAREGDITLVYSAQDTEHNNAMGLRLFLIEKLKPRAKAKRRGTVSA